MLTQAELLVVDAVSHALAVLAMLFLFGMYTQAITSCPFLLAISADVPNLFVLADILAPAIDTPSSCSLVLADTRSSAILARVPFIPVLADACT